MVALLDYLMSQKNRSPMGLHKNQQNFIFHEKYNSLYFNLHGKGAFWKIFKFICINREKINKTKQKQRKVKVSSKSDKKYENYGIPKFCKFS